MKCEICGKPASNTYTFYTAQKSKMMPNSFSVKTTYANIHDMGYHPVCKRCAFELRWIPLWLSLPAIWIFGIVSV